MEVTGGDTIFSSEKLNKRKTEGSKQSSWVNLPLLVKNKSMFDADETLVTIDQT
jgi:hypothetical protein